LRFRVRADRLGGAFARGWLLFSLRRAGYASVINDDVIKPDRSPRVKRRSAAG